MKEQLQEMGLTEGESKVYLALLKHGPSSTGPLSKQGDVAYSKIYQILERLMEKGLVRYTISKNTKYFSAESPQQISKLLEHREEEILLKKQKLPSLVSELEQQKRPFLQKDEAQIFKGQKGVQTAYELFLENTPKQTSVCFFYVFKESHQKTIDKFYAGMAAYFREMGHSWYGITTGDYKFSHLIDDIPDFMDFRYVSFPLPGSLDIGKHMILHTVWSEHPVAILIESEEIANHYREYFHNVWKQATPVKMSS